jgi:hypothetical protein
MGHKLGGAGTQKLNGELISRSCLKTMVTACDNDSTQHHDGYVSIEVVKVIKTCGRLSYNL